MENTEENSEKMENTEDNSGKIGKIQKKSKLNSENMEEK
jgi:hypothetical protein